MAAGDIPLYFEGCWSILSTIGLVNALFGLMVIGTTGYSPIILVPIVVSVATAIANGLCYYAFYEDHETAALVLGTVFADIFWLVKLPTSIIQNSELTLLKQIQEAELSFYSNIILIRVLHNRRRVVFLSLFWVFMTALIILWLSLLAFRAHIIVTGRQNLQDSCLVEHLHIGNFVSLAIIETISAFFLLQIFSKPREGVLRWRSVSTLR